MMHAQHAHITDDQCLDLAHGLLEDKERVELLEQSYECSVCESRLKDWVSQKEKVVATWNREHAPAKVQAPKEIDPRSEVSPLDRLREWFSFPKLALGSGLAAAALAIFLFLPAQNDGVLPLPSSADLLNLRGEAATNGDTIFQGFEAYNEENWKSAISLLQTSTADEGLEALRQVYLGSAFALDGQYQEALDVYENVDLADIPEPWRSESRWTQAMCLEETGKDARAQALLEELAKESGEPGRRAQERLK
ncbi:MAG: hypothetical protein HKN21_09355 [Candidatus Eisenbacteria bacterium]|uniref:ESX-1 secretion system protein EccA1-like N-terminal domain-containing protein n=1 Tax=Eiseniibacteriota bacterium TaxID=2212470 RepID=A0A7Y2EBV2_UNCEI|nr:hypothetical protein [Candidatus Eisenbacteria bacterium]